MGGRWYIYYQLGIRTGMWHSRRFSSRHSHGATSLKILVFIWGVGYGVQIHSELIYVSNIMCQRLYILCANTQNNNQIIRRDLYPTQNGFHAVRGRVMYMNLFLFHYETCGPTGVVSPAAGSARR